MQGITDTFIIAGHSFLTKLFRLISSLNSVEYKMGFRLEEFFFSVFFVIIHLLRKLNRLHPMDDGRPCFFKRITRYCKYKVICSLKQSFH